MHKKCYKLLFIRSIFIPFLPILIFTLASFFAPSRMYAQNFWMQVSTVSNANALAIDPGGHNIFAGAMPGIYLSTNDGINWTSLGLNNNMSNDGIAVKSNGYVFAGCGNSPPGGVWLSTNNGNNWSQSGLNSDNIDQIMVKNSNGYVFAAAVFAGVYYSTNNGTNWIQCAPLQGFAVTALQVNNKLTGSVFAADLGLGTDSYIYRSTNNGANWTTTYTFPNSGGDVALVLACDSTGRVFAGTYNGILLLSTNDGVNWTDITNDLPSGYSIMSMSVSSLGDIFVGFAGNGVYRSTNNGTNWSAINTGLTSLAVEALRINSSGYIFAGTDGGIFRSANIITNIREFSNNIPESFKLHQNYPNPFNPATKINYQLPITNYVKLSIYDILGREVTLLVNEKQNAGTYQVEWDGTNYPSGVYFYKLVAGDYSETKRMALVK